MKDGLVQCCNVCVTIARLEYELGGDGDGVEFLLEIAHRVDGTVVQESVVFVH